MTFYSMMEIQPQPGRPGAAPPGGTVHNVIPSAGLVLRFWQVLLPTSPSATLEPASLAFNSLSSPTKNGLSVRIGKTFEPEDAQFDRGGFV
jgi:hypothetical protein